MSHPRIITDLGDFEKLLRKRWEQAKERNSPEEEPTFSPGIESRYQIAVRGTQLDLRTRNSTYMPILTGALLTYFLYQMKRYKEASRKVRIFVS